MFRKWVKETHWPVVIAAGGLLLIGTLFIYSAAFHDSANYLSRQYVWLGIAAAVLFGVPFIGYRTFLSLSYVIYGFALVLLVLVSVMGNTHLGAQRWISIGPIVLQPSEFAKIATILALANYLGSNFPWENRWRTMFGALALVGVPLLLIVRQPDLGTSLLFIPVIVSLLWFWGAPVRLFVISILSGAVAAPLLWQFLKPYQQKRILVFLDPTKDPLGSGYTAIQSKIAVGSGGWFGKGYLAGTQSQLNFVPEHHTDFIFCVLGEEWGFFGALLLLGLYAYLFYSAFRVMESTTDIKAKLLVTGVIALLFSQVFINIGMSFGLMPITGITLPLVSYGGSSLLSTTLALGLILSIHKERSIF